ncbi:hypothetical protein J1614_004315 [Plenodomus biglobosus]|nr:hypothetical protein J1614_004315 [Plenodomus biglobosus]
MRPTRGIADIDVTQEEVVAVLDKDICIGVTLDERVSMDLNKSTLNYLLKVVEIDPLAMQKVKTIEFQSQIVKRVTVRLDLGSTRLDIDPDENLTADHVMCEARAKLVLVETSVFCIEYNQTSCTGCTGGTPFRDTGVVHDPDNEPVPCPSCNMD